MLREDDYISLTDIMKTFEDEFSIYSWMRNKNTVEFLDVWEQLHNPDFKGNEFVAFKNQAGGNSFNLTPSKWINATGAVGMKVKTGRYGGSTFAHKDIAISFCSWLSLIFQLYLIKEFQRLKRIEIQERQDALDWSVRRGLSKLNYRVQTDAIKERLIPARMNRQKAAGMVYATEAGIINIALFGMTAKAWRMQNPDAKGNIRDDANIEQLVTLVNLQALNAQYIRDGLGNDERLEKLNEAAIKQMQSLINAGAASKLLQYDKK